MDATGAIIREIAAAKEQERELFQIRVTPAAMPGAPVSAAIAPDRAEELLEEWEARYAEYLDSEEQVRELIREPPETARPIMEMHEVLIHPSDWQELRHDHPDMLDGEIYSFNGLRVDYKESDVR
jgi:hypothetical protein